jgi:carbohydrate kinase (thermoresistant glucokinase family)
MHVPVVVMGVSGAGKSAIGARLAVALGVPFVDGDDLHPAANVAKMAAGIPLDDDDRWPWLDLVGASLAQGPRVVACSALKRAYRDRLRATAPDTVFVEIDVDRATLLARVQERPGHFMPASLLDSQLTTLEPLGADETGCRIDGGRTIAEVVAEAVAAVGDATA